ncbi:AAA family ATPase [Maribacter polysiphoniae]|uniref:AAA family ATPase n=1 Tax=Maribacter polysiphoniae TaxID=429344 RepID=A0A316E293_9FLAO|nr:AAA family ATPase [Maribacter polysiphoniae]MBD1261511.1 AAA family ATPase [Maribacter polysiphoniae]PWK22843.1 ATPase family protein associated with various cellular activities (AAA) [Maribacter polysiphoniae]
MKLIELIKKIEVWSEWVNAYKEYVPKFIVEASTKENWEDWDSEVFFEFFEKSNNQCVSSLKQGYFTKEEQSKIKNNWAELGPLLKIIADNQDNPQWETYEQVKSVIRRFTAQDRRAATYRVIAGLQPNNLSTIVKDDSLKELFYYIHNNIEEELPEYQNNWFKDSHSINSFYKEHNPSINFMDLISYPWQTFEYFKNPNSISENSTTNDSSSIMKQYIDLLHHKKQIILQGPPGTGKTRLAQLIAEEITKDNSHIKDETKSDPFLSDSYIREQIKNVKQIPSSSGRKSYGISNVQSDRCTVTLDSGSTYDIPYAGIKRAYNEKLWLGGQKNGFDSYDAAIAKYLFENKNIEQPIVAKKKIVDYYKIIQFHPSYTYEDFVRGITVENNEAGKIEYKTENRILADYASKALKNYNDFYKDETTFSNEVFLEEYFSLFVDKINEEIENNEGFYRLTKSVGLINTDEDAFRYKSPAAGWNQRGDRMLFKDIKQAFLDGNIERQDLKRNENLSGLAKQHASYFVRVLNLFQQFINDENLTFNDHEIQKDPLNNYVLIIDEINRANLSSVLGELIYALEYRGKAVDSMYGIKGDRQITLPPNLFIIGTMNTADRSVGQIDYAIRRRFAFVDILPEILIEADLNANRKEEEPRLFFKEDIFLKVKNLFIDENGKNSEYLSDEFEAKDVQLGHSYFIYTENNFNYNLDYEIKPILREYVTDGLLKISALPIIENL